MDLHFCGFLCFSFQCSHNEKNNRFLFFTMSLAFSVRLSKAGGPTCLVGAQFMTLNTATIREHSCLETFVTFYLEHFFPSKLSSPHLSFCVRPSLLILPKGDVLWGPFLCQSSSSEERSPLPPWINFLLTIAGIVFPLYCFIPRVQKRVCLVIGTE